MDPRAQAVLDFWFGDPGSTPAYLSERNALWFRGGPEVDEEIRRRFEGDLDLAVLGRLDLWAQTPRECLALIVLLDQFSLNLYREKPRSYTQSALAIPLTNGLIASGEARALAPAERVFVYLPLEHSELLADQERSVELFRELAHEAPPVLRPAMDVYLDFAVRHWRVVARFGRFPDRNEVFGRPSRPEEVEFLASDEAPF